MSLSRPMTSNPASTKCVTDSEPINPPEPVTIAVGIARSDWWLARPPHVRLVGADPLVDIGQDLPGAPVRAPVRALIQARAIGEVDRDIARPSLSHRSDVDCVAGQFRA